MANTVLMDTEPEYTRTLVDVTVDHGATRAERKEQTRQALLDSTLKLLTDRTFESLSLREVARAAGIVPTAFYRHFDSMDDLGVALVENATRPLRAVVREARSEGLENAITDSVALLAASVREHEAEFRFIVRERNGAPNVARAITAELTQFAHELVVDLARIPALRTWSAEDLEMVADLMVNASLGLMQRLVDIDPLDQAATKAVVKRAERQLRLIVFGMAHWRSS